MSVCRHLTQLHVCFSLDPSNPTCRSLLWKCNCTNIKPWKQEAICSSISCHRKSREQPRCPRHPVWINRDRATSWVPRSQQKEWYKEWYTPRWEWFPEYIVMNKDMWCGAYLLCYLLHKNKRRRNNFYFFLQTIGKLVSEMNKNNDLPGVDGNSVRDQDGGAASEGTFFF